MFPKVTMFPVVDVANAQKEESRGKSFLFDFKKGDFVTIDGRLVEIDSLESVKVWILKILKTEKFKFKVYDNGQQEQYGISLLDFINKGYPIDFVKVEIEREVRQALSKNPEITRVHSFIFLTEKRKLVCEFTAETIYGEVESGVIV
ncbi:DUF2634 domain-containing protein [Anaerotignum sp. MB30-C6]|uniref:DUF2634 domain-containing protein n=1 Tax=Anaerotignum sp. MB30-C6 TaxID=3070814 RepID=UPI0027DBC690|nr:DUF2634 domain-containing protein [Anaerotignum sp. MB30-C6]WMI80896.1 DUF2634 domain-containing protein [Anaerotignum sp. MB30-C6]